MKPTAIATLCASALSTLAPTQQHVVVPASRATTNAPSYGWIPGASQANRQQTLIGASHLTSLVNKTISAIELRRHAVDEAYTGGTTDLTVTLSISPLTPIECTDSFAANTGSPSVVAFSGQITIPATPAHTGGNVAWSGNNIVRIQLATPYLYTGGTLCVDIVGTPVAGQTTDWWMAGWEAEDIWGSQTDLGGGCGNYGGATMDWSRVSSRSLLPGAYARFEAYGTPGGLALAAFGTSATVGIPLSATGLPAGPGCDLWLATVDAIMPTIFMPPTNPATASFGGEAKAQFKIPNSPSVFGFTMTTQWVDWSQMATSNAIEWTVANATPTINMAMLDGDPTEATGVTFVYQAPVMRFEYQ